jgi:hypothetical protein
MSRVNPCQEFANGTLVKHFSFAGGCAGGQSQVMGQKTFAIPFPDSVTWRKGQI